MKNISRLFNAKRLYRLGICTLAAVLVFAACEGTEGPMGNTGATGAAGPNASASSLVVFECNGGVPAISAVPVKLGGTIPKPADPTKAFTGDAGLYRGMPASYEFAGWYRDGVLFDFNTPVSGNMTLSARWAAPAAIDLSSPTLTGTGIVAKAVQYIKARPETDRAFTLLLDEDVNCAPQTLDQANFKLAIMGVGGDRKINLSASGTLFTVGAAATDTTISLTLGKDITLVGRSANTAAVVTVQFGANFTMLEGSKVTGNASNSTSYTTGYGSAVNARGSGIFTMKGGAITGNTKTVSDTQGSAGFFLATEGIFRMEGGNITGNTATAANIPSVDVGSDYDGGSITVSGNAVIGSIMLNRNTSYATSVTVAPGWTGKVDRLYLRVSNTALATVVDNWYKATTPLTIVQGLTGDNAYTLKATDIAKFPARTSMYFLTSSTAAGNTQNFTVASTNGTPAGGVKIENSETNGNIGKLVQN